MVVIGIDFGNDSCVVSVWRNGRIDIVTDEFNCRYTPSMVGFDGRKRLFGISAKHQWAANASTTLVDFKSVLDEKMTKKWIFDLCNFTENIRDSSISFKTTLMGQSFTLSPCQVLAMLFIKIKAEAQAFMQTNESILGCIISVPPHFNDQERKGVLMAAAIAKLDCHSLIKDTTAVAINYSLYKKFTKPINVIFVDFGQSSIQISACRFFERRLEMIEEVSDWIGGRDIDEKVAEYLMTVYKIFGSSMNSKTFCVQLLYEVEKLKKKMSSSVQRHQLMNFSQSFSGADIFMTRSEMDNACAPLYTKIEDLMKLCLERSKLTVDEIHSIELVGGSSNLPVIQKLVARVFNQIPIATMNRDEAVARGCLIKSLLNANKKGYQIVEKPFADAVDNFDNFDSKSSAMKDLVRVFQVHRLLKCDRRDSFQITEDEFMGYVETEKKLTKIDLEDVRRSKVRRELNEYLLEHMKPGGILDNCSAAIKKEANETKMWDCGTADTYDDILHYWRQKVEKLSRRKVLRPCDDDINNDPCCITNTLKKHNRYCDSQVCGKRLTFSNYDEVTLIQSSRSSSTSSENGPQLFHRRGFRSHYRRLKRKVTQSTNVDESQALYRQGGQRKKRGVPWCCFL